MRRPWRQGFIQVIPVRSIIALLTAVSIAGAACSSNDDPESFPPIETSTTADETTTTTERTTTTVETTTTTAPSTTTLPTEKPDLEIPTEWDSELDEIFGRYLLYWDAFVIAMGPPEADPNYEPLIGLMEAEALADLREQIDETRLAGEIIVDPEDSKTAHGDRLPNPSTLTQSEGNEAVIQDCYVDALVVQALDGTVLNDAVAADLLNVKMKVIDGEWRVFAVRDAAPESSGYEECRDQLRP